MDILPDMSKPTVVKYKIIINNDVLPLQVFNGYGRVRLPPMGLPEVPTIFITRGANDFVGHLRSSDYLQ